MEHREYGLAFDTVIPQLYEYEIGIDVEFYKIIYSVQIKETLWFDEGLTEAEVLFGKDNEEFWAFCQPCDFKEGEMANIKIDFLEDHISEEAFWNENRTYEKRIVPSESTRWRYYCYGQLQSINPVMIDCDTLTFSLGYFINDVRVVGSYVYFVIERLDIFRA